MLQDHKMNSYHFPTLRIQVLPPQWEYRMTVNTESPYPPPPVPLFCNEALKTAQLLKASMASTKTWIKKKSQALCPHAYNLSTLGSKDGRGPGLSGQAGLVSLAWNTSVRDPVSKQKWKTKQKHQLASRWVNEWYPRKNTWGCPPTRLPHMRTYTRG